MGKTSLVLLLATASLVAQSTDTASYTWSGTGPLRIARLGACVAALPDGRMVVAGGQDANGALRSVEIYQTDGTFAAAQDMQRARSGHSCTSLADGRVLVSGGLGDGPAVQAETYDPVSDTWTPAENGTERWNHTATLLPDGRVLLAGGETADGPSGLLEWFNPITNRIRPLPVELSAQRTLHASAPLPDGSVLVTGGWNAQNLLDSLEIVMLDGSVLNATALPAARAGHTATALDNGCVLIAGGVGADGDLASASLYCSDSGTLKPAGDMSLSRYGHLALRLPNNGKVLVTGGFSQGEVTATSELYDPDANAFVPAGSLTLARLGIAAAADPVSGAVLAVGGNTADGPVAACGILRTPSVVFDKTRYLAGDTLTVTGLGWTPGEIVKLQVTEFPLSLGLILPGTTKALMTTASALGRIQQVVFNVNESSTGDTFRVTATGVTSGLTASSQAVQISRTNVTLNILPFPALTRQALTLQAVVQPVTNLGALDGTVTFLLGTTVLGSVSTTKQFINVTQTGQITDGTSNTFQFGETLPNGQTGFGSIFQLGDGSVRTVNPGGVFQLVTRDIPASASAQMLGSAPGSVTASYAPITSLYAPSSIQTTVSVQKRTVSVNVTTPAFFAQPKVGDPIPLTASVTPTQQPLADLTPTGNIHISGVPGAVIDAPLSPLTRGFGAQASVAVKLPAGTRTFSAQFDGDNVYLPGNVSGAGSITIGKGSVGFALIPSKSSYTVGEQITLLGRILHPQVAGATPTGTITPSVLGPAQFKGATVGTDPQNTGVIDTNLPVMGFPSPGNIALTMTYSGDANFQLASAGTILTITKAVPQITLIPPIQVTAGQQVTLVVRTAAPAGLTLPPVSGQVTLSGVANGASAPLSGGIGTIRQTFPTAGTFTVSVQYGGDTNYQSTTSATVQVVVQ